MELLRDKEAIVYYSDPYVPLFPKMREHKFDLESLELNEENLVSMDCVVISTDHDIFDYSMIRDKSKLIIDTRGVFQVPSKHIIKA